MRKFLSMEQAQFQRGVALSLEEEQLAVDEAAVSAQDISQDLAEAERVIEVSDALEDLAVVADQIEEATPTEIALIQSAGDMAVAGTEVEAEQIVPSMEAFKGGRISTESLWDTAATIWKNIQEYLKKVWANISKFFKQLLGIGVPGARKRVEDLEKKIDGLVGTAIKNKDFKLTSSLGALSVDYKVIKNEGDLKGALKDVSDAADFVFKNNADRLAKAGNSIAKIIGDFDPEKQPAVQAGELASSCVELGKSMGALPGESALTTSSYPDFEVKVSKQLMGNVRLMKKRYNPPKSDDTSNVLGKLDRLRRGGISLEAANEKAGTVASEVTFQTLHLGACSDLLKSCHAILDTLEDFETGKGWKELDKVKDTLKTASDKAAKAFDKATKAEKGSAESQAIPYYKAMLNFNTAFARWVQSPAVPFASHALTSVRAVMVIVQKSLAQYG